jgi:hypothetical protein
MRRAQKQKKDTDDSVSAILKSLRKMLVKVTPGIPSVEPWNCNISQYFKHKI